MFAIQKIARQAPQLSKVVVNQRRNILSLPPRCKVSVAENILHGSLLWLAMMGIPVYIACNVTKYASSKGTD